MCKILPVAQKLKPDTVHRLVRGVPPEKSAPSKVRGLTSLIQGPRLNKWARLYGIAWSLIHFLRGASVIRNLAPFLPQATSDDLEYFRKKCSMIRSYYLPFSSCKWRGIVSATSRSPGGLSTPKAFRPPTYITRELGIAEQPLDSPVGRSRVNSKSKSRSSSANGRLPGQGSHFRLFSNYWSACLEVRVSGSLG